MQQTSQHRPSDRLLVVMPNWISDCVLAMPTLRALRALYPKAHIAALVYDKVKGVIDQCPYVDQTIIRSRQVGQAGQNQGFWRMVRHLGAQQFDTAVVLADSFRAALLVRMAGIRRRVGYDRDGRGFLLTDRLLPRRHQGTLVPVSMRDAYLGIAQYLGATQPDASLELFTRPADELDADKLLDLAGYDPLRHDRLIVLCPDAAYGQARRWPIESFAQVADLCSRHYQAAVAVSVMPQHKRLLDRLKAKVNEPILDLPSQGLSLSLLKSIIVRSDLVITNDTGPRQIAAAFDVPVVTIFGPSHPAWGDTQHPLERQVRVDVVCGPCQKKRCPLPTADGRADHRCMKQITPDMVMQAVGTLLETGSPVEAA